MKAFLVLSVMVMMGQAGPARAVETAVLAPIAMEQLAENAGAYPIKPSEAAMIAQRSVPDSKVLNVKLLPSGEYVVTLKAGGSVQRVMVNATTGATS